MSSLIGFVQMPQDVLENISALIIPWEPLQAIKKAPPEVQMQVSKELKAGNLKPDGVAKRCHALAGAHHPACNGAPAAPAPVFNAGGQSFTFTKKGKHLTIVTDADHVGMLDVFMQNLRCALVEYSAASNGAQAKAKETAATAG